MVTPVMFRRHIQSITTSPFSLLTLATPLIVLATSCTDTDGVGEDIDLAELSEVGSQDADDDNETSIALDTAIDQTSGDQTSEDDFLVTADHPETTAVEPVPPTGETTPDVSNNPSQTTEATQEVPEPTATSDATTSDETSPEPDDTTVATIISCGDDEPKCPDDKPVCDTKTDTCVECTEDDTSACTVDLQVCDAKTNLCSE